LKVTCDEVRYLEHVQANVTLSATRRGDIHIYLTSPAKTKANLLAQRPMDNSRAGFNHWPFMSVHTWGETPNGEWSLEIHNEARFVQGKRTSFLDRLMHFRKSIIVIMHVDVSKRLKSWILSRK